MNTGGNFQNKFYIDCLVNNYHQNLQSKNAMFSC